MTSPDVGSTIKFYQGFKIILTFNYLIHMLRQKRRKHLFIGKAIYKTQYFVTPYSDSEQY